MPALVKIYKLLINELSNAIEESITHGGQDDEVMVIVMYMII